MSFITADQLFVHAISDYVIQSDYMATEKLKKNSAALAHVVTYTIPFLFLTTSWKALAFIMVTHFVIDRWRLARYVCWVKNFLAPKWIELEIKPEIPPLNATLQGYMVTPPVEVPLTRKVRNFPWSECVGTGYHTSKPPFLSVWLLIITDNLMHVGLNALALKYMG